MSLRNSVKLRKGLAFFLGIPLCLLCGYQVADEFLVLARGQKIFAKISEATAERVADSYAQKITAQAGDGTVYGPFWNSFFTPASSLKPGQEIRIACFRQKCVIAENFTVAIQFAEILGVITAAFYLASVMAPRRKRILQMISGAASGFALAALSLSIALQYFL